MNKGKKHSEEWNRKISEALKGNKSYLWKGGINSEYRVKNFDWNILRKKIYKRDNWTCQVCRKHCRKDIQCHHLIPYRISQDDRMKNLITLCKSCHKKMEHSGQQYLF